MITDKQRTEAITLASRAALGSITELRASGKAMSATDRDALLARAVARESVELELDVLAYEQGRRDASGKRIGNRNGIRVRDGAMMRLGSSGAGRPFLRDHLQGDVTARGGTVLTSKTSKLTEDGHYEVRQTVRLTEPAAVERALRGLMSTVSIGLHQTGPVNCTACSTEVLSRCFHFPGDTATDKDGAEIEVEWEFTSAELVETSEVSVPAVPSAAIKGFRAALALSLPNGTRGTEPQKETRMIKVCTMLGLAATAGEDEITKAVEGLREQGRIAASQRDDLAVTNAELSLKLSSFEATEAQSAEDKFISGGIAAGKVNAKLEADLRAYFKLSRAGAASFLENMPVIVPVGAPPQRNEPAPPPKATGQLAAIDEQITAHGGTPAGVRSVLRQLGVAKPGKALATHGGHLFNLPDDIDEEI